jgi:hypothetical protein
VAEKCGIDLEDKKRDIPGSINFDSGIFFAPGSKHEGGYKDKI